MGCQEESPPAFHTLKARWTSRAIWAVVGTTVALALFGHQVVPNPDFFRFVRVGEAICSFDTTGPIRRGPLLGTLQVLVQRSLHIEDVRVAAWALHAVLFPVAVILFWEIARRTVPRLCIPATALVVASPVHLKSLVHPLAELPLMALSMATFLSLLRGRRDGYVWAGLAGLIRLDGLLLFVWVAGDQVRRSRRFLLPVCLAALAAMPAIVWSWWHASRGGLASTYFADVLLNRNLEDVGQLVQMVGKVVFLPFAPLFRVWSGALDGPLGALVLGLALLGSMPRSRDAAVMRAMLLHTVFFLSLLAVLFVVQRLLGIAGVCPRWPWVLIPVTVAVLLLELGARLDLRSGLRMLVTLFLLFAGVPAIAHQLRRGEENLEFVALGEWFAAEARPGERLWTPMSDAVALFARAEAGAIRPLETRGLDPAVILEEASRGEASSVALPGRRTWKESGDSLPPPLPGKAPFQFSLRLENPSGRSWIDLYVRAGDRELREN